ncbi:MAG: hypothetical protein E7625_04725 [Ruminococcaceae bacterium]|nr:hypothetical protein [Oscillospiraceae bacterium]
MGLFFLCFAQIVLYTLGVMLACGLAVEVCYRLFFLALGRRAGRFFWFMTSWLGTPLHELGHALMCVLFAHRIEYIRLFPTKEGDAMVEHSYNGKNPYAVFGNLWIGLGPVFSGLAVIIAVLYFVYPVSMQAFGASLRVLLAGGGHPGDVLPAVGGVIQGLFLEETRAVWIRVLALVVLFSVALHVRVSTADIKGMLVGLPGYLLLSVLLALIMALTGEEAVRSLATGLQSFAYVLILLFSLILLFAIASLLLVLAYRLIVGLIRVIRGDRPPERIDLSRYSDYRDRDWDDYKS